MQMPWFPFRYISWFDLHRGELLHSHQQTSKAHVWKASCASWTSKGESCHHQTFPWFSKTPFGRMTFRWTQMLKQTLYVFLFKWRASGKFQVEKLDNVWRPHLKSLPPNCYMSQNKTFTRNLQTLEKLSYTNLKFDLKLVTLAKNSLWHIWNLKLSITWETCLAHTSNFNVETLNNLKNFLSHIFSNFNIETFNNLKNSCSHTLHLKLKEHSCTLENLQHFEEVSSTPPTHLEKLQAPCMPPLGNELTLTLQTKNPYLKRILSFLLCTTSSKPFTICCFNTMSILLLNVGP